MLLNKLTSLKSDIEVVQQSINPGFYRNYFLFPFLVTRKFAATHYCIYGWKRNYNPTETFNTKFYVEKHLDIKRARINPFSHYHQFGYKEERVKKFETEEEYFEIAPTFIYPRTFFLKLIARIILKDTNDAELFSRYFDVREYRRNIGYWKFAFFRSILGIHYLLKGNKNKIQPSQIYDPVNAPFSGSFIELIRNFQLKIHLGIPVFDNYKKWILENENTSRDQYHLQLKQFSYRPLISIVMPIYNADLFYLKEAIQSVRGQLYENWELCIADDKSLDLELLDYLKEISKEEKVKVHFREENGHISACTNSALNLAEGEFIALLDQDDLLSENALFEIVHLLNEDRNYKLIFSNEDKINEQGKRFDPYFKKGWNYHLLLSQNYVNHLGIYSRSVVESIGGFRKGYEGSQDYDLLLRFIEKIDEEQIGFVDKVLYHWRAAKGSTALNIDEKGYAVNAGIKALQEHLDRTNQKAKAMPATLPQFYRVKRELTSTPLVSILIPTRNHLSDLKTAVDSILNRNIYQNFEILIINNDSTDPEILDYFDKISRNSKITVIDIPGEFNYSAINNKAAKQSKGELLLLLNNDIEAINNLWLEEMISQILPEDVAIVGAKLLYPDDTIQHAGVEIGLGGVAGHIFNGLHKDATGDFGRLQLIQNYDAVTGACLLIKKKYFDQVEGLNEVDLKVAFNDVDLCLKIRALGKKVVYTPYAELYHYESKSRGSDLTEDKIERFNSEIKYFNNFWKEKI